MTIRTRLALWYSGLLTLIIVIFSISVITVSRVTLLQTVDQVLATAAQTVISIIDPVPVAEFGPADTVEIFFRSQDIFHAPGISVQVWRTHNNGLSGRMGRARAQSRTYPQRHVLAVVQ